MRGLVLVIFVFMTMWLFVVISCKKPYLPPASSTNAHYLVVEGTINTGNGPTDSTIITLRHTVTLSGKTSAQPELNAVITVEPDQNADVGSHGLSETGKGRYVSGPLGLDNMLKYRLRIKTSSGKEYLSDAVDVKSTPPIDSIGYTAAKDGVHLYSNAHDPNNNTRYYRWDYIETWQFHAKYESDYVTNGTEIVPRDQRKLLYSCYQTDTSSTIILNSSAKLAEDVIFQNPLTTIPSTSEKIETKYSILVRQYAITKEAFDFWQNLKKNTEQLGSIFDAQPSQISGNIHCTSNAAEPVIGYISASSMQTKRIFITNSQLPNYITTYPYQCEEDSLLYCRGPAPCKNEVQLYLINPNSGNIPTRPVLDSINPTIILGYFATDRTCMDCTIRGFQKQPDFWR